MQSRGLRQDQYRCDIAIHRSGKSETYMEHATFLVFCEILKPVWILPCSNLPTPKYFLLCKNYEVSDFWTHVGTKYVVIIPIYSVKLKS